MGRLGGDVGLIAVVEADNLTAASREPSTPLATETRKAAVLETHLGVRLLNRSTPE
jgi:DNA-binding transcriptional LysR family regulator